MHFIIEETTDAGRADTRRFRFQIKGVAQHAAFPKLATVAPWLIGGSLDRRQHSQREARVGRDVLMTADQFCDFAELVGQQQVQRQMRGPPLLPQPFQAQRLPEIGKHGAIAQKHI